MTLAIIFYVLATLALIGAVGAVTTKNPVFSVAPKPSRGRARRCPGARVLSNGDLLIKVRADAQACRALRQVRPHRMFEPVHYFQRRTTQAFVQLIRGTL